MNVLYVTPDLGEGDILRREFSARDPDLRFESTATPHEAIERLEAGTSHYDAVLLELTRMNGEGLSLVRHIRKNNLPVGVVAIVSARDDAPSEEVLESGADLVVVKGKEFLPRACPRSWLAPCSVARSRRDSARCWRRHPSV